jgi:hypothetical protein
MTRFPWAAWGLLVVVLDLPLYGWDVLPDLVGYAWVFYGLTGAAAVHPAFVRARAAAVAGAPLSLGTGTPRFAGSQWAPVLFAGFLLAAIAFVVVVHQVLTGLLAVAPDDAADTLRWAAPLRTAVLVTGAVVVIGIVAVATPVGIAYPVGVLANVLVGILTVVLLHRVARAGWIASASD